MLRRISVVGPAETGWFPVELVEVVAVDIRRDGGYKAGPFIECWDAGLAGYCGLVFI